MQSDLVLAISLTSPWKRKGFYISGQEDPHQQREVGQLCLEPSLEWVAGESQNFIFFHTFQISQNKCTFFFKGLNTVFLLSSVDVSSWDVSTMFGWGSWHFNPDCQPRALWTGLGWCLRNLRSEKSTAASSFTLCMGRIVQAFRVRFFDWKCLESLQRSPQVADVARQFLGFGSVLVFHQGILS